ncbi:hypothetical protein GCM10009111_27170 [Colwellia asteriadis]|uniref:Uncharacterized protein n=1 Tax=Colwellia asteriadis TaxID=517723 RepID=A0ABN1LA17_9GAMM
MRNIGLIIYWVICSYLIVDLVLLNDWVMFFDPQSIAIVFFPTLAAIFIQPKKAISQRLNTSFKVCWFSGGLMFIYGAILTLQGASGDSQAVLTGLSVALIPIIYCFIISLLYAPYVLSKDKAHIK